MRENLKLVIINTDYIEYLRQFDTKVCFNKEWAHTRPYVGILFKLRGYKYFAPLTSSGKGNKLKDCPKQENITFFPIKDCIYGGVNLNNMIPVVEKVYKNIDLSIKNVTEKERKYRLLLINQLNYLNKSEKLLRTKANKLYTMKTSGKLYENYEKVTCDFKKLEEVAKLYQQKN